MATGCSGTDSPLLAAHALSATFYDVFEGLHWLPSHRFSSELDKRKREFLVSVFGAQRLNMLFGNCTDLGATAYDFLAKKHQAVPSVSLMWMGFPCKDVSSLCQNRSSHREAMANGDLGHAAQTGGVFRDGVLAYIDSHGEALQALVLENVMGLAHGSSTSPNSPLDVCVQCLRERGLHVVILELGPSDFGWPQSRQRLWILGFPLTVLGGMNPDDFDQRVRLFIGLFASCAPTNVTIDRILLPSEHVLLTQSREHCRTLPTVSLETQTGKRSRLSWPERHLDHCKSAGKSWWSNAIPSAEMQTLFPTLRAIAPREFDLLQFKFNVDFPERTRRMIDVSQSFDLAREEPGTVTPGMRCYLTDECRLATGFEAICLQALHFEGCMGDIVQNVPGPLLQDLAGNSFHGWVVSVVFLLVECLLAECVAYQKPVLCSMSPCGGDDDSPDPDAHEGVADSPGSFVFLDSLFDG
jgi:hypothetical protein